MKSYIIALMLFAGGCEPRISKERVLPESRILMERVMIQQVCPYLFEYRDHTPTNKDVFYEGFKISSGLSRKFWDEFGNEPWIYEYIDNNKYNIKTKSVFIDKNNKQYRLAIDEHLELYYEYIEQ